MPYTGPKHQVYMHGMLRGSRETYAAAEWLSFTLLRDEFGPNWERDPKAACAATIVDMSIAA